MNRYLRAFAFGIGATAGLVAAWLRDADPADLPWWLPFGQVPEVTPHALRDELQTAPPQLVDVRQPAEFAAGHIAGAVNVPLPQLPKALPDLNLDPTRPVVLLCLSGHRSIPAARLLNRHGYNARQLAGGMQAWRAENLPESRPS